MLKSVEAHRNVTVENGVVKQDVADTREAIAVKVTGYNGSTFIETIGMVSNITTTGVVAIQIPKTNNLTMIIFGIIGAERDTLVNANVSHLVDGDTYTLSLNLTNITQGSISWCDMMLNEGSTALPYEPYFEGLRDTKVTELRSTGANILPYPYHHKTRTHNGITFTDNGDGTVTVNGTSTGVAVFSFSENNPSLLKIGKTYSISGETSPIQIGALFANVGWYRNMFTITEEMLQATDIYVEIRIPIGNTIENVTVYPMLNVGSTPAPYKPYVGTISTLEIPEKLRAFLEPHGYGKGINESVYNYIDFEKKQFFKRVGMVGLSDLSWTAITSEGAYYTANLAGEIAIDYKNPNMISENYTTSAWTGASVGDITMNAQGYIRVYTDVKPSGILYYELATPEIIDISEYLTDDNFIEVEGGGTIMTINENEYAYDVPTTISYVSTIGGNENE